MISFPLASTATTAATTTKQMPKFWSQAENNASNEKSQVCVTELKLLSIVGERQWV